MPVRISAVLDHTTVVGLIAELTPFIVELDTDPSTQRWMRVERPDVVELVPGVGARIRTSAKVSWSLAGVSLPFTIRSVVIVLRLVIDDSVPGGKLDILPMVEDADLKNVPDLVDAKIVEVVNSRLAAKAGEIAWKFGKLLTVHLGLPPALGGVDAFDMRPQGAVLEIGAEEIRMSLDLLMRFDRTLAVD